MKRSSKWSVKFLSLMMSVLMMLGIVLSMGGEKVDGALFRSNDIFGEINNPDDIEFDEFGNMYIANIDFINKITPDGKLTTIESGGIYGPLFSITDIEFDNSGNMYISSDWHHRINKITPEGIITIIDSGGIYGELYWISNIEFDGEGNLYVGSQKRDKINKISPDGSLTVVNSGEDYGVFTEVSDIKFDFEGNMWIGYKDGFNVIETNGDVYEFEYEYMVNEIEFDKNNNIYLVSTSDTKLVKFTENDVYVYPMNGIYGNVFGIKALEFDNQNNMYYVHNEMITRIFDYSGTYNIVSKKSNLLMDVYNGGKDQGVNVIQWPETGGQNQQWNFELLDNGFYKITSVLSGLSLDVYNAGTGNGNRVIQWPYHGGDNQQWYIIDDTEGTMQFMSKLSYEGYHSVLDVYNGGITPGVNVIQWYPNYGDNQKWYLQPVEEHTLKYETNGGSTIEDSNHLPGVLIKEPTIPTKENLVFGGWYKDAGLTQKWNFTKDRMPAKNLTLYTKWEEDLSGVYSIRSKNSDLVMDVYNGGSDQGVNVIQWPLHGRSNQQWRFESLNNGYYKVSSMLSGMSIDVYNGGTDLGNRVIQWPYHGGTNQQWKIIKNSDDTISLMSRLAEESGTGYLLDVFGGGMDQGVNVIQWTAHYGNNQKWIIESVK